ncbi:MAG: Sec-independent protein translocase TatB [Micrococcaceae bacterium]
MFGINSWDLMILLFIAVFVVGPDRMQRYAKELPHTIRKIREMSEGAKSQIKDELGDEYADLTLADIKKYDPRQYDPRKIIKEALSEDVTGVFDDAVSTVNELKGSVTGTGTAVAAGAGALVGGAAGITANNSPEENVRLAREAARERPAYEELPEGIAAPFDPEAT